MKVVNVKKEKADVFCGRNSSYKSEYGLDFSKLGNPFRIEDSSLNNAISQYKNLVWKRWDFYEPIFNELIQLEKDKGTDLLLGCFCKPKSCHCDIIISAVEYMKKKENNSIKIGVVGGRDFNNPNIFKYHLENLIDKYKDKEIILVSGGAKGADTLAEKYAKHFGLTIIVIPAMWDKYGKKAGIMRNKDIWRVADVGIAFWDLKSPGTKNSIEECKKLNKDIKVIQYFDTKIKSSLIKRYSIETVKKYPNKIFVFGDNLEGRGKAGQAIIRDQNNSFGIPTKRKPSMNEDSFFSDKNDEKEIVINKLKELYSIGLSKKEIVFPLDGLGTGLSKMETMSPNIFNLMNEYISKYFLGWKIIQ